MRTFLIILLTALLSLIGAGALMQEGLIPGLSGGECSTQIVKTYEDGTCPEVKKTGAECPTPWGTTATHGDLVLSFKNKEGTLEEGCVSRTSICNDGQYLDDVEPYDYEKCGLSDEALKVNINANHCTVNGFVFADGTTQTFYKAGSTVNGKWVCDSQERSCTDGETSGDNAYAYYSCHGEELSECLPEPKPAPVVKTAPVVTPTPKPVVRTAPVVAKPIEPKQANCPNPFGGYRWEPGKTGTAYKAASVPNGSSCESVSIVCAYGSIRYGTASNPGAIVGGGLAQSCSVLPPNPCSSSCGTVAHGETVTTYSESLIPFGSGRTCEQGTVVSTCTNGSLSPATGSSCSCNIAQPSPCVAPNGQTVSHESSLTLYQFPKVQALPGDGSDTCVRQWRQCINGSFHDWNGSPAAFTFQYASCDVIEPPAGGGPGGEGVPTN